MSSQINKKTFTIQKKNSWIFNLYFYGFAVTQSLISILIVPAINFAATLGSSEKLLTTLHGGYRTISAELESLLRANVTMTNKISFSASRLKEKIKSTVTITSKYIFTPTMKLKERWETVNLKAGKFTMTADAKSEILNPLSLFDPETLATLDVLTLGDMDIQ